MRKILLVLATVFLLSGASFSQFSFHLIDNFEDGDFSRSPKWWHFGKLKGEVIENHISQDKDLITESCGEYCLNLSGETDDWYVGGIGTDLGVDASPFTRFQIDVYGGGDGSGKLKIELFDDDNQNYSIEQDPSKNYEATHDDKWVAEVNIQGRGYTRTSIPFSAFKDANPGVGDDVWNPDQKDGSGGLLKMQLVAITAGQQGVLDFNIDNLLITF